MAIEWKATCGTASASIKCKRPNFDDVKKSIRHNQYGKSQ